MTPTLTPKLTSLRASCIAAGWTAESPAVLDPEAERMAREDKWSDR